MFSPPSFVSPQTRPCWYEGQAISASYQQVIRRANHKVMSIKNEKRIE
jgi:hypothetical protein